VNSGVNAGQVARFQVVAQWGLTSVSPLRPQALPPAILPFNRFVGGILIESSLTASTM
jgi:hypothetical protein